VFERADKVTTIVEVKYNRDPIGREIVAEKLAYFDRIITLDELSEAKHWR
jgi:hypothetical protein